MVRWRRRSRRRPGARDAPGLATAAERLIAAVADDVDVARYRDSPLDARHRTLLRRAAEARGLDVIQNNNEFLGMHGQRAVFGTLGTGTPLMSSLAVRICGSKRMTLHLLRTAGVPVLEGRSFHPDKSETAIEYASGLGWPVVLKPSQGKGGQGIVVGIRSVEDMRTSWQYVVRALGKGSDRAVIVEREHDGVDVRVYVVGGEAVAGVVRLPAYVRGDGRSTVDALVKEANHVRRANPYLHERLIVLDEETDRHLASQELTSESVPGRRRIVPLRRAANCTLGGQNIDVTDRLPSRLAEEAVRAVDSVPGLDAAGVDFLVPDVRSANGAVVLELNAYANIAMHHFPVVGQPRDVAGAIVDRSLSLYS